MSAGEYREGVCVWCAYWQVCAPNGWEPPRYNQDAKPHIHDWFKSVRKKNGPDAMVNWPVLQGECCVDPQRVQTTGAHGCARYVDWLLKAPTDLADDYFNRGWRNDRLRDLQRRNEKLKRQVVHHKKLAESRWARLQELSVSEPAAPGDED